MKKIIVFILCLICMIGLIGCAGNNNGEPPTEIVVTFDANGGSFSDGETSINVLYEGKDTFQLPDNPTKEGYIFKGWYLTTTATEAYNFNNVITASIKVYAQYDKDTNASYVFSLNEDGETYKLARCEDEDIQEANIPTTYNNKPVTEIGQFAFQRCEHLEKVTIPNGVTSIGDYAFRGCSALTSISIPDSITSVGEEAFSDSDNIKFNEYDNAKYLGNEDNQYVVLIEAKSTGINSCNINNNTKVICDSAFDGCSGLTSITIPNSVVYVGKNAFKACEGLTRVNISSLEAWCNITFIHNPLVYAKHLYLNDQEITELTIPNTITEIKDEAFYGCSGLTSLTIPEGVTSVGDFAFGGCDHLTSVSIPDSILSVGSYAFVNCPIESTEHNGAYYWGNASNPYVVLVHITGGTYSTATSCEINSNTKIIYDEAFNYCSNLESITIPNGVRGIGVSAFGSCNKLTSITIPDSVTYIRSSAFLSCYGIKDLTIGANVTEIEDFAFSSCINLTKVVIPSKMQSINWKTFAGCTGLTSVTIGENVKEIGYAAFENCYKLVEVVNLSSLTIEKGAEDNGYVGQYALDIYTTSEYTSKLSTDSNGFIIYTNGNNKTVMGYTGNVAVLTLPNDITGIIHYAFLNNSTLTSVTIQGSIKKIDDYAFKGCENLHYVTIGDTLEVIGEHAFEGCHIHEAIIPTGAILSINNTQLQTVELTSGEYIGSMAFKGCTSLTAVTIPNTVKTIGKQAFVDCVHLTSITIPTSVTEIEEGAFVSSGLTSVNLPSSVKTIETRGFAYCNGLLSVTINNGITEIGDEAFRGSSALSTMTFDGTREEWNAITKGYNWNKDITATRILCSDGYVYFS